MFLATDDWHRECWLFTDSGRLIIETGTQYLDPWPEWLLRLLCHRFLCEYLLNIEISDLKAFRQHPAAQS